MVPERLRIFASSFLAISAASALPVVADVLVAGHLHSLRIKEVVRPLTALSSGPLGLAGCWSGRRAAGAAARSRGDRPPNRAQPFAVLTAKSAKHGGSFATSCVVNRVLLRREVREPM